MLCKISPEHIPMVYFFSKICKVYEKYSIVGVFSNEFCQIYQKNYLVEHLRITASARLSYTQPVFTCSNPTIEAPEQCLKPV